MNVTVNGERREIPSQRLTVSQLLDAIDVEQRQGIAVARNLRVVPKSRWDDEAVEPGDEIEIVRATQGG